MRLPSPILYYHSMTVREEVQRRIAEMDEAALADVLLELDFLEERRARDFPQDFVDMMNTPKENGLTGDEALKIATQALKEVRRNKRC